MKLEAEARINEVSFSFLIRFTFKKYFSFIKQAKI